MKRKSKLKYNLKELLYFKNKIRSGVYVCKNRYDLYICMKYWYLPK